jgi:methanogenic corrinoid protein MtbC1
MSDRPLTPDPPAPGPPVAMLRAAYLSALLSGEVTVAERVIRDAIDSGLPEAAIGDEIITPAMVAVGDRWARREIGIADEHLATSISLRMVALQREAFRAASERRSATVLLAGAEDEHHALGLELAASALGNAGYEVRMLGPDVPVHALIDAVARMEPAVVGLTTTMPGSAVRAHRAIELLRLRDPSLGIVVGGATATRAVEPVPGIVVCRHVADACDVVDGLVQRAALN